MGSKSISYIPVSLNYILGYCLRCHGELCDSLSSGELSLSSHELRPAPVSGGELHLSSGEISLIYSELPGELRRAPR